MTRPLGYDLGGIVPKEKPVNFKALMAEFDTPENIAGPGEPVGIEKIIADQFPVDPRFTAKQKIKEMLGIGGDQGSESDGGGSLMDSIMNLFMMNELTKVGIDWDDDDDLVIKYIDKFGDPYDNIKKLK